jgi:hypothetical protein
MLINSDVCLVYKLRLQNQQLQGTWKKSISTETLLQATKEVNNTELMLSNS